MSPELPVPGLGLWRPGAAFLPGRPPVMCPLPFVGSLVSRVLAAPPPPCAQNVWDLQKVGLRFSVSVPPSRAPVLLLRCYRPPNFTMPRDTLPLLPPEGAQGERLPSSGGSESDASGGACSLLLGAQQGGSLNSPSCAPLCAGAFLWPSRGASRPRSWAATASGAGSIWSAPPFPPLLFCGVFRSRFLLVTVLNC